MQHEILDEESRLSRRTPADALEVLRKFVGFDTGDRAEIEVGLLRLPSEKVVGLVFVKFAVPIEDKTYWVSLPTSAKFTAVPTTTSRRTDFDIAQLDGAVVESDGSGRIAEGTTLHAITVIPARLPIQPSASAWLIVYQAIRNMKAESRSLKSDNLPVELQEMIPDFRFVDCGSLPKVGNQLFKVLADKIQAEYLPEEMPSAQHIADALREFGIRVPKARPRK